MSIKPSVPILKSMIAAPANNSDKITIKLIKIILFFIKITFLIFDEYQVDYKELKFHFYP